MSITIRLFASLREQLGTECCQAEPDAVSNVEEALRAVAGDSPQGENVLVAVNMEYVKPGAAVKDGDEVAFFPPVTGG